MQIIKGTIFVVILILGAKSSAETCNPVNLTTTRTQTTTEGGCFYSAALRKNVKYSVTFPKGYPERGRPYPVIYYLHGRGGDHQQFSSLCQKCATAEGAMPCFGDQGPPGLVISVAQTEHTYWKDSPDGQAKVFTMVTEDLARHIERSQNVANQAAQRGIMGISMGGHGAVYMNMKRPDIYGGGLYAISPIFRSETTLEAEDVRGFGKGASFRERDPVSMMRSGVYRLHSPFYVEIAKDDELLRAQQNTQDFFQLLSQRSPQQVSTSGVGGHASAYWCGAIRRSMDFFAQNFSRAKHTRPATARGLSD